MFVTMLIGGLVWIVLFYGTLLFLPAGTYHWPRAWAFLAVTTVGALVSMLALRGSPELLKERWKGPIRKGQPLADRVVVSLLVLSYCAYMAFIPLDVFHYHHLLGEPSLGLSILGLALYGIGWVVMAEAMRENAFASPSVRYQEDRGQKLVDRGLYGIVRHPMYLGAAIFSVGPPLWLGSFAGALAALTFVAMAVIRIPIEEKLLRERLTGYEEYTRRVPYRLIPRIW